MKISINGSHEIIAKSILEPTEERTGSVFILPTSEESVSMLNAFENGVDKLPLFTDNDLNNYQGIRSDANYNCPIKIMRFFTSFGVNHFNKFAQLIITHGPIQSFTIKKLPL